MSERWRMGIGVAVCVALGGLVQTVLAETPSPSLPTSCSSGDVVVARGGGGFECMSVREMLRLDGCNSGDFVTIDSGGRMQCVRPSSTPWGIQGLLPDCSSGNTLVSEGFGRWRCVEGPR